MKTKAQQFAVFLNHIGACDEARAFCERLSPLQAYKACKRGDWLLWIFGRMAGKSGWPTRQDVVLACCDCAALALKFVPKDETRPARAIEVTRAWAHGKATIEDVQATIEDVHTARVAAYAAADAAYAAADAAYAAADAAAYAVASAASASAAAYAAAAAAAAAAVAYAADAADAVASAASASAAAYAAAAADAVASAASAYAAAAADADADAARRAMQAKCADIVRERLKFPKEAFSNE